MQNFTRGDWADNYTNREDKWEHQNLKKHEMGWPVGPEITFG